MLKKKVRFVGATDLVSKAEKHSWATSEAKYLHSMTKEHPLKLFQPLEKLQPDFLTPFHSSQADTVAEVTGCG